MLTSQVISIKTKGRLYAALVKNFMVHGSETWPFKKEDITKISRTDEVMIRWMCNEIDARSSKKLKDGLGIPDITEVLRRNRLIRFWHVTKMDAGNPASARRYL